MAVNGFDECFFLISDLILRQVGSIVWDLTKAIAVIVKVRQCNLLWSYTWEIKNINICDKIIVIWIYLTLLVFKTT